MWRLSQLRVSAAASVFASHTTYLEALVERHLASVQMLVERSEHLDAPPRPLPVRVRPVAG